jgi:hypothetical protein
VDCARLVNNEGLPLHVTTPTIIFAATFGVLTLLKTLKVRHSEYLPSGLAAAVGSSHSRLYLSQACITPLLSRLRELLVELHHGGGFGDVRVKMRRRKEYL